MGETSRGPVFKAGRDQHIAYSERGKATLNVAVANNGSSADVLAELRVLRETLGKLGVPAASSAVLLDAAEKVVAAPEPDRTEVAGYVQAAVKLAVDVNGFAEQADKLIPRLQHIAAWAGQTWDAWRLTLGL